MPELSRRWSAMGIAIVLAVALAACGSSSAPPASPSSLPGTTFTGDGYTVLIPDSLGVTYSRDAGADTWENTSKNPMVGFSILIVGNLLPPELSLEGALGRAKKGLADAGTTVSSATPVALPGGPAYRVTTDTSGVVAYAFYHAGTAALVMMVNVPADAEQAVAASFRMGG